MSLPGKKRREFVDDHLLADAAEGAVQVTHLAVEFRSINAAMIVVCALEESDCADRYL